MTTNHKSPLLSILIWVGLGVFLGLGATLLGTLPDKWLLVTLGCMAFIMVGLVCRSWVRMVTTGVLFSLAMVVDINPIWVEGFWGTSLGVPLTLTTGCLLGGFTALWFTRHRGGVVRSSRQGERWVDWCLLLFCLAAAFSWFRASRGLHVLAMLPLVIEFLLLYLWFVRPGISSEHVELISQVMAGALVLAGGVALWQYLYGIAPEAQVLGGVSQLGRRQVGELDVTRVSGLFNNPNNLAFFLSGFIPVVLSRVLGGTRGWGRWLAGAGLLLGLAGLVLTQSRGGWVATVVCALAVIGFTVHGKGLRSLLSHKVVVVLGAVGLVVCLLLPIISHRLAADMGSMGGRTRLAETALRVIDKNPWTGVGLNNYRHVVGFYDDNPGSRPDGTFEPVHNIYLHTAAELGLPALALFVAFLAGALWCGFRAMGKAEGKLRVLLVGVWCGLTAMMIHGLVELGSVGHPKLRGMAVMAGLLVGAWGLVKCRDTVTSN